MQQGLLIFILLFSFTPIASAFSAEDSKLIVAKELAVCAAYFFIGAEAAKNGGDSSLSDEIKLVADATLVTAIKLSDKKTATDTLTIAIKDHQRMINNNIANIGALVRKYKDLCKNLVSSPKKRYEYWQNKK